VIGNWTGGGGHAEDVVVVHGVLVAIVVVLNSSVNIVTWVQEDLAWMVRERVSRRIGGEDVTDQWVIAGHSDSIAAKKET